MYEIEKDPVKRRVILRLDKYEDHDSPRFIHDLQHAALSVKGADPTFDILADFSDSMVMPQHIAQESADIAAWLMANGLRKSANVSRSVTQKMQVRRVTHQDKRFGLFETRADAEAWLDC